MKKPACASYISLALCLGAFLMLTLLVTCGGGGEGGGVSPHPLTGTVTTTISDQPTCQVPNGSFENVWVTISRVRAHTSSTAGPNDSGWVDLIDLRSNPMQLDLLSLPSTTCLLTQIGLTSGIPAGQYKQIRLYLLSNSPGPSEATPAPNNCNGSGFNCVVTASGTTNTLLLSSEAQTGIKIPSEQIAGGGSTVPPVQSMNLNIDFDACSSIIQQGNGQFRLKPVLHAGEISLNNNFISGKVVDRLSNKPILNAIVLIEQSDPLTPTIDRIIAQTTTGPDGGFIICPLPSGTYDIVVAAKTIFTTYNATVTLQVPLGTTMPNIPLFPEQRIVPATISGQVTTTNPIGMPTNADLNLSALQQAGSLLVTIPPLANSTPNLTTENGPVSYTLVVPASNPSIGTFSISPPTFYALPVLGAIVYWVNARAFAPMNSSLNPGSSNCSPSSLPIFFDSTNQLIVTPGGVATKDFTFTGCE